MNINQINSWGRSSEGCAIPLFYPNNVSWEELHSPILMIGGMHGDEPEGVALANSCKQWLETEEAAINTHWCLITCINPDGYNKNQRTNGRGVDLNRNFPSSNWSPQAKEERYFPGPNANSEPETQALVQLILNKKPQLIIHFHSWKPCVVCTGEPGLEFAQKLADSSKFPIVNDIGYPTPGSLSEFAWHDLKIPVICTEDKEHRNEDIPWQTFGQGIKKIILNPKI